MQKSISKPCQDIGRGSQEIRDNIDVSKAFGLLPHDRLLTKISTNGVDLRVVVWVKKFLLGRSQSVRVDRQLSEEVRVMSGVPQGSVLGPLLFPVYVDDIWKKVASNIRLFADDFIIYRKIKYSSDIDNLQT